MRTGMIGIAAWLLTLAVACGDEPTRRPPPGGGGGDASVADASAGDGALEPDGGGADAGVEDTGGQGDAEPADSGRPQGEPITVPAGTWTWVDFPGTSCNDGTPTGIGVNRSTQSENLLIFLNGGGACWDYTTCLEQNTATLGPFGADQFRTIAPFLGAGLFDRTAPTNAFRDWSYVFVPYCTGDLHAGDNVVTYTSRANQDVVFHHAGHTNVLAYLERLAPTFTDPPKVVLSGASAGGFGTLFNYVATRDRWPDAAMYMIDDSGPPLPGGVLPEPLRAAWVSSWRVDLLLEPLCGAACVADFSLGLGALARRYPDDRFSLLSSLRDTVIRSYTQQTGPAFEAALLRIAREHLDPTSNFKYFYTAGERHTMLGAPEQHTVGGVRLDDWLRQQVSDDPAWESLP